MGHHLTSDGKFKSNKYDWCPEGFLALKFTDPKAWHPLLLYGSHTEDLELASDIKAAVQKAIEEADKK